MTKLLIASLLLVLTAGAASGKISLPEAEQFQLDNGLVVNVIEKHNLPLFSLQMTFRAGSTHDPVGQEGLASLASDMLMRGTPTRTAKQVADEVAFGGGALSNYCGRVSAGFRGEFLTAQGENAFEILADLVLNSSLPEDEFDNSTKPGPVLSAPFRAAKRTPVRLPVMPSTAPSWARVVSRTLRVARSAP